MCLSIPAKVISIEQDTAKASVGGTTVDVNISLVDDIHENDYILIHSGFALEKIDEEEAQKTLELFEDFEALNQQMDAEENEWRQNNQDSA